jgi:hypothetical protein
VSSVGGGAARRTRPVVNCDVERIAQRRTWGRQRLEAVSKPLRKGDRHILLRGLRKMSQSPAVLKLLLVNSLTGHGAFVDQDDKDLSRARAGGADHAFARAEFHFARR